MSKLFASIKYSINLDTNSRFIQYLAFLTGFAIPTSTSLQNITIVVIAILVLFAPRLRSEIKYTLANKFILFSVLLYITYCLASLDSSASYASILHMLNKMRIFILAPLIYIFCRSVQNKITIMRGFFWGAVFSLLVSLAMYMFHKPMFFANTSAIYAPGDWPSFRYHTYHNYFLGIMLLVITNLFIYYANSISRTLKYKLVGLSIITIFDMFYLVQGRAGQALFIGMLIATFMFWSWKRGVIVLLVIGMCLPIVMYTSPALQNGIKHMFIDVHSYDSGNSDTSIGYRLEYHKYSKEIIAKRPIVGYGTGSFQEVYHKYTGFTGDRDPRHPHNDFYWLWIELGIMGPLLLIMMTISLIYYGYKQKSTPEGIALIIFALSYVLGAMQGGFYTDNITSSAFMVVACILLSGENSFKGLLSSRRLRSI